MQVTMWSRHTESRTGSERPHDLNSAVRVGGKERAQRMAADSTGNYIFWGARAVPIVYRLESSYKSTVGGQLEEPR
mgnify:CR=1 FL=1